ncbi:hypothetical protein CC86DRAFT_399207 [Ophiobolus disseminans]|uniref:Heterokaryon incompatibility domain-containing protein n=1 Tax=Ophiobolus disseminans TaxID=1469910 RepID=A0A6A6ZC11_9PLEO|nr:hypothetical protein CC86DRAFT_399207 [Ophiobolus disseminans]
MRLLQRNHDSRFTLTEFTDHDKVTLANLEKDTEMTKAGYIKLQFCADQASKDNLRYFWVDTCCINKTSSAELTKAINSMSKWYRKATQCYAYLSDVSTGGISSRKPVRQDWYSAFQQSSNKYSLLQELHSITKISIRALQGSPLGQFGVNRQMSWMGQRKTKRKEDIAYSLLGIFDIHMPLIYGEGRKKALARLQEKIKVSSGEERD